MAKLCNEDSFYWTTRSLGVTLGYNSWENSTFMVKAVREFFKILSFEIDFKQKILPLMYKYNTHNISTVTKLDHNPAWSVVIMNYG